MTRLRRLNLVAGLALFTALVAGTALADFGTSQGSGDGGVILTIDAAGSIATLAIPPGALAERSSLQRFDRQLQPLSLRHQRFFHG